MIPKKSAKSLTFLTALILSGFFVCLPLVGMAQSVSSQNSNQQIDLASLVSVLSSLGSLFSQIKQTVSGLATKVSPVQLLAQLVPPTSPTLPQTYLDTTFSLPIGGTLWQPMTSADFQVALDNSKLGDIIQLQAGATYTGHFTLSNKTAGSGWIYIISSAYSQLPAPGTRVSPSQASLLPKIVTPDVSAALDFAFGSHHYRLVGLEITTAVADTSVIQYGLITMGDQSSTATSLSQLPNYITFDRDYIHGTPGGNVKRGIALNSASTAVVDSYLSDFHVVGIDAQAIGGWNGSGPFKIVNNELEGSTENVIFGGGLATIPNLVPSDIEIRNNHFFKPLSWYMSDPTYAGVHWTVKNLLEFKNARRVLVDGNILENNWVDAQVGLSLLLTPRTESGAMMWATVSDITITNNILRHAAGGMNILTNDGGLSLPVERVAFKNNLFYDINRAKFGGDGRMIQVVGGSVTANDVVFDHDTLIHDSSGGGNSLLTMGDSVAVLRNPVIQNIVASHGDYGVFGGGVGEGVAALSQYMLGSTFQKNVIFGTNSGSLYPSGNFFPADAGAVGFVDYLGNDFHLSANSPYKNAATDGMDVGANIDTINSKTNCVVSGSCGSGTTPSSSLDNIPPSVPAGLVAASYSSSQINLTWTASTDNVGVTGYKIYRAGLQIATSPTNSYSDTGLTANTTYTYTVSAYDAAGNNSAQSVSTSATTFQVQPPPPGGGGGSGGGTGGGAGSGGGGGGAGSGGGGGGGNFPPITIPSPTNLQAKGTSNQILLYWKNPLNPNFVKVRLTRDNQIIYEGNKEEFIDTNLVLNRIYSYSLVSLDHNLNSSQPITQTSSLSQASNEQAQKGTSQAAPSLPFTKYLYFGKKDPEVRQLQQFLNTNGFIISQEGPGSPSNETTYYGQATRQAVRKFQCKYRIICKGQAWGNVGPLTRAKLNNLPLQNSAYPQKLQQLLQQLKTLQDKIWGIDDLVRVKSG